MNAAALALTEDDLDAAFSALADRTRRSIIARLSQGEASVMELAGPFSMSQPAISKHLKVLERAGLVSRSRDAQRRPCRLEPERLHQVNEWLGSYREFWEHAYGELDLLLAEMQAAPGAVAPAKKNKKRPTTPDKETDRVRKQARDRRTSR